MSRLAEDMELTRRASAMAASAAIDLFAAYDVHLDPSMHDWQASDEKMLCGMMGFVGSGIRGTCMLASHMGPIERSCPEGGRLRDWIAELTNQLAGRLKSEFLGQNVELGLSTPMALSGVRVQPLPKGSVQPICLEAQNGAVLVWVEVETRPEFALEGSEGGQLCRSGGAILLF